MSAFHPVRPRPIADIRLRFTVGSVRALRWVNLGFGSLFAVGAVVCLLTLRAFSRMGVGEVWPDAFWSAAFLCLSVLCFMNARALRKAQGD